MTIYSPIPSNNSELCHPVEATFESLTLLLNGEPRAKTWIAPQMELIHEDEGTRLKSSDSPWFTSSSLVFRRAAIEALGSLLRENGELLPLACPEAELWIFNATRILDALDEEASDISRFENGRIMWIKKYVFRENVVDGVDIFKITGVRSSVIFVSEAFVQRWKTSGLKGLDFKPLWSSSETEAGMSDTTKHNEEQELTERLRKMGASEPEDWARSEAEEGIPQSARYLFLRQAWRNVVSEDDSSWIASYIRAAELKPDEPFAGIGHALKRLSALGAPDDVVTDLVRGMQAELLFQLCYLLEDPGEIEEEADDIQWALVQTDDEGNVTGQLTGLHESVLEMDPTGREMRPRPGAAGDSQR